MSFINFCDLYDIQSEPDLREIDIDNVGISDLLYPINVLDRANGTQAVTANISMQVDLPKEFRGTHMSRFIELLHETRDYLTLDSIEKLLKKMLKKFNANSSHVKMQFNYFIEKKAPISKSNGLVCYECEFIGNYSKNYGFDFILGVKTPVTTLCPCSKAISLKSAHNQRSFVDIHVRFKEFVWIEDIVNISENSSSAPIFSLLKRPDEKFVTELAYDNPRFVEDVVRNVAKILIDDDNITWFVVEAKNFESIHNHNAYAIIKRDKRKINLTN